MQALASFPEGGCINALGLDTTAAIQADLAITPQKNEKRVFDIVEDAGFAQSLG